jgi:hypothetical protein
MFDNMFDRDDGIRSLRDDAARRDRHRFAGLERPRRRSPGSNPRADRKRRRNIRGANRVPIHRRARKGRQVDQRKSRRGKHPADCIYDQNVLSGQRLDALQDERERLVDPKELLHSAA